MTQQQLPPDVELVDRLHAGDQGVVELLVSEYWSPLCNYAAGIVDGVADPQDVVQEAFIRLWRNRERWRREGSVRGLLYTVTRNAALDQLRRGARKDVVAQIEAPATGSSPFEDAVASDLVNAAAAAISRLPPKRQEIFRLAREEGLTYAEIAAVLDLSPQTVANHMSLALADLRRDLAEYLTEETS
jgi:RNA polymerase sigma-70 factor (ECF subfamily)